MVTSEKTIAYSVKIRAVKATVDISRKMLLKNRNETIMMTTP